MTKTGVVWDNAFLEHVTDEGHPEHPRRLLGLYRQFQHVDVKSRFVEIQPVVATDEEVLLVHSPSYLDRVKATASEEASSLSADTFTCRRSYFVSSLSAGGTIEACRKVVNGELPNAIVVSRPPGHHAERYRAMGFCIFNNVAIAAKAAQETMGLSRVIIVDWDLHHGNGTQHTFERDPSVFFFSSHQFPHYPGTGSFTEIGLGPGEGTTMNVPMVKGCGDSEFIALYQRLLSPVFMVFRPELVLVSAGVDIHVDDPLGGMKVTSKGFAGLTKLLLDLATVHCGGRVVFCLEGGYNGDALADSVLAMIDALNGHSGIDIDALAGRADPGKLNPMIERCLHTHRMVYR
jgi:acetoin utilization deacetylase AcuC-like enzyme